MINPRGRLAKCGENPRPRTLKRKSRIFRYVDAMDVVPKLPTVSLIANSYTHCLTEQLLGGPASADAAAALKSLSERLAQENAVDTLPVEGLWTCLKDRIAHHMVASYLARIEEKQKTGGRTGLGG